MNTKTIDLTDNEYDLILMMCRYCEINHPNYRKEYKKLATKLTEKINQITLFGDRAPYNETEPMA